MRRRAAPIAVGQHFSLDAVVCARDGARPATGLRVDALLLFHMPGRWQLVFDVETGAGSERLVTDLVLP